MTAKEVKKKLDEMGIAYQKNASLATVLAILEANTPVEGMEEPEDDLTGGSETPEVEPQVEETQEPAKKAKAESVELPFGAMMKENVQHNGQLYEKGTAVDLETEKMYKLFESKGWIE